MQLVVLSNEDFKNELLDQGSVDKMEIFWIEKPDEFLLFAGADAFIDLSFQNTKQRMDVLKRLSPKLVIVNSVIDTLKTLEANFIRINGWKGFLKRPIVEAACNNNELKDLAVEIFLKFKRTVEWVPDQPGFLTARIVSMIMNEAYFALGEKISTKQEIDVALKLGTNYPFGPFEWAERIGLQKIHDLLTVLSKTNPRYKPAPELTREANN